MKKHRSNMKGLRIKLSLALGGLLLVVSSTAQSEISLSFDLNDRESLLIGFFDSDSINNNEEVLWLPLTFADQISANISDDGLVHTALDTILFFNSFSVNRALVLFETLHYKNGNVSDCQACGVQLSAAIFQEVEGAGWEVLKFMKHFTTQGSYGLNGESGLIQMGDDHWGLKLQMSWTGQGIYGEYVTFYDLENFEKLFTYTAHEDNIGAVEDYAADAYSFDKAIHFIPTVETESGWWDFDMVTQGTQKMEEIERAVPANSVQRYHYNWDSSNYAKSCE
jgi:hypothetical protein